ncbi:RNA guanine-N7 methyltransferase-activating subunit-like protein [Neosynchiropus ocellatus]
MAETEEKQQSYEEMFAHRFTSEDREYQEYVNRPADPPPIVEDWRSRGGGQRGRDNRYQDRRGYRDGGWGRERGWGGGPGRDGCREWRGGYHRPRHMQDGREGDRDSNWSQRSGQHSSSNRGSYHERPHYY